MLLLSSRKNSPCLGIPTVYDTESNWDCSVQNYTSIEQVAVINNYVGTSNSVTIPDSINGYNTIYNATNLIFNSVNGNKVTYCFIGCKIKHRFTTMANMFYDSAKLVDVHKSIVGPKVTNMYQTFMYCRELVNGLNQKRYMCI